MKTYSNRPQLDGQDDSGHTSILVFLILNIGYCDRIAFPLERKDICHYENKKRKEEYEREGEI
jgi:hypothetical protein